MLLVRPVQRLTESGAAKLVVLLTEALAATPFMVVPTLSP